MERSIHFFLTIALFLFGQYVYAQTLDLRFNHLTVNEGLSHSDAMAVIQDKQGYIWIGTNKGMDRFDGIRIKNYSFDVEQLKSISGNRIRALHVDDIGTLYSGGENCGLNQYDVYHDHFSPIDEASFPEAFSSIAQALAKATVTAITTDKAGQIWVGTASHGIFVIQKDNYGNYISIKRILFDSAKSNIYINDVKADPTGRIWIGSRNSGLYRTKPNTTIIDTEADLEKIPLPSEQVQLLYFDTYGNLWTGIKDQILFARANILDNLSANDFQKVYHGQTFKDLSALLLDSFDRLWIGTSFGLYILHNASLRERGDSEIPFENATLTLYEPRDDNPFAISSSRIHKLYEDRFKTVWIAASSGGINKVDLLAKKFGHISRRPSGHATIPNNYINTLHIEEDKELLWIGTRNGFSAYDLKKRKARNYLNKEKDGDVTGIDVSNIMTDRYGTIWVGTWNNGFYLLKRDGKKEMIDHYVLSTDSTSRTSQSITYFAQDKYGAIWMATAAMGLRKYSPEGHLLQFYDQSNSLLPTSNMSSLFYDSTTSILWAGTQNAGLLKILIEQDTIKVLKQFKHNPEDSLSLGIDYVWPIFKDRKNDFWIGTIGAGLHKLTRDSANEETLIRYRQWLPESDVESILEDDQGNLWIGGAGLFKFNPDTKSYIRYDVEDGLQSNSFKVGAACRGKDGTMYFGGINGISFFNPEEIKVNPGPPIALITALRIHNKPVQVGEKINGRILLKKNLSLSKDIIIKDVENDFSFDFVSLHYTNPAKHMYAYKLDGYHDDWIYLERGQQSANFSNLDAGHYTFMVKATNGEGKWSTNLAQVNIEVMPPWWKTWWAYILYTCFMILALWVLRKITVKQQELKNKLVIEQIEHEKEKELTELKLNFFTKISHELRTPLTLILGPVEDLVTARGKLNGTREKLTLVHKQTHKLLTLVNELMDFRKVESKKLPLNVCRQDIVSFIHELFLVFQIKAREKHIDYRFTTEIESLMMFYDPHKIEMVITNLLSNAFKYTPEGRTIEVSITIEGNSCEEAIFQNNKLKNNYLTVKVRDWGVGMNTTEMNRIFDFYYRAAKMETLLTMGSGVGLSLAKEIVERHAGNIMVNSQPGEGAEFTIQLPFGKDHFPEADTIFNQTSSSVPYINEKLSVPSSDKPHTNERTYSNNIKILLVEDNEDVLLYLYDLFSTEMQVSVARNGEEGWKAVLNTQPDLILSDIMMQPMNGLELCRKIKEDTRTMHIPVCLLTARAATAQELEGLELGADDYIVKPFIPKILQARIRTIIKNVNKKREYYQKQILLEPTEIVIPDEDRILLELSMKIVEENLEDSNFNVQVLVKEMGMSQSAYYRKMKSITGQTVVEFIRDVRLKRAAQLLRESKMRVSEVAFMVGIEDIKYFRKVFRNVYKMSPSEYGKHHSMQDYSV